MCKQCPGYPTKCKICGYENHTLGSKICISCIKATKHEQERIIKLLEKQTMHHVKTHYEGSNCSTCSLIALIKGEK